VGANIFFFDYLLMIWMLYFGGGGDTGIIKDRKFLRGIWDCQKYTNSA